MRSEATGEAPSTVVGRPPQPANAAPGFAALAALAALAVLLCATCSDDACPFGTSRRAGRCVGALLDAGGEGEDAGDGGRDAADGGEGEGECEDTCDPPRVCDPARQCVPCFDDGGGLPHPGCAAERGVCSAGACVACVDSGAATDVGSRSVARWGHRPK